MRKVLISRYGAYGDICHASHLPRLLKDEGFDVVDVETNFKGYQLLQNNPFIDNLIFFEPTNQMSVYSNIHVLSKHWETIAEGYDKFVNLYESIEVELIAAEKSNLYYMHQKHRKKFAEVNYYDATTLRAGYPHLVGKYWGELYFTEEEHKMAEAYMSMRGNPIMVNLNGTTLNKVMRISPELIKRILDKYPDMNIVVTGDKNNNMVIPESDRISNIIGKMPFRQAALLAKYSKLVITMESGLGCVANLWKAPTLQMMTCASIVNHANGCKNDFSLQSPARCSPCCKAQYNFRGCPSKDGYPLCVYFDVDVVMNRIEEALCHSVALS